MKNSNSLFSYGETIDGVSYKVLNEREIRGSSGIMLFLGTIAFVYGFVLSKYTIIPYISGFLLLNFLIAVFINPKFVPTMILSKLIVGRQTPLYIGAIQKRFAWSLGIGLSMIIFALSLKLVNDESYFEPVCMLCIACLFLLYSESVFGICLGCKIYFALIKIGFIPKPQVMPNCMGDACRIEQSK